MSEKLKPCQRCGKGTRVKRWFGWWSINHRCPDGVMIDVPAARKREDIPRMVAKWNKPWNRRKGEKP